MYLSGSSIHVVQDDSVFNFTDLIEYHLATDTIEETDTDTSSSSFNMQFSNIELYNGAISFEDKGLDDKISLKGIDLFIPHFGMDEQIDRASGLKFNFENGGFLQTNVDWDPVTKNLEGTLVVDRLDLFNFYGYSQKFVNLGSLSGFINATINFYRPKKDLQTLWINGSVDIEDFLTTAVDGDTLAGFKNLHVSITEIWPLHQQIIIDSNEAQQPG